MQVLYKIKVFLAWKPPYKCLMCLQIKNPKFASQSIVKPMCDPTFPNDL